MGAELGYSYDVSGWTPKTKIGRMVYEGEITDIMEILLMGVPIKEPEIVDYLLGDQLKVEVVETNLVQRMTDSGRRNKIRVTVVVGNEDGIIGVGAGKAKEFLRARQIAEREAKMNIIYIRRGCGSWECGCGTPHSVPFTVKGKMGSVEVWLKPAPRGVGLVAADTIKPVLRLAGVRDVWTFTRGHTKTTYNFVMATFEALKETVRVKIDEEDIERLGIVEGPAAGISKALKLVEKGEGQ
ncbi:MAG: 30S ribosomal protein S5 [Euryarchaeota archaeon]|nr:30S ribosomal protein S5 [Euryarchaeota archaeon]MCD6158713.1 30S ribosomal protein S5 [Euryarchaeota archaeon]